MALTRDFKETIQVRIKEDPAFREEMLKEGVECLLAGDMDTGKAVLRDYINAAVGFQELAKLTAKSPKSLMRMFGQESNVQRGSHRLGTSSRYSASCSSARDCISKSTLIDPPRRRSRSRQVALIAATLHSA